VKEEFKNHDTDSLYTTLSMWLLYLIFRVCRI